MNKKIFTAIAGLTMVSLVAIGAASPVFATEGNDNKVKISLANDNSGKSRINEDTFVGGLFSNKRFDLKIGQTDESVAIRANGEFKVTGATANSVNAAANTINISLLGFTRDINVSGAVIHDATGAVIALSNLKAGDKLSAVGTFDKNAKTIKVTHIVDVSLNNQAATTIQNKINELLRMVDQLRAQLNALGR